ncbi:MAG: AAA family ATPase [Pseudomonadota bacterium]
MAMIAHTVSDLAAFVNARSRNCDRFLVGIAGPPGVGKSTLAEALNHALAAEGDAVTTVPMDGFHLDNDRLKALGLLKRKGAPETFDARGFVTLVRQLKDNSAPVSIPAFDRDADCVRPDAAIVATHCRYVLIEGNYLLLDRQPWSEISGLLDCRVFLTAQMDTLRERLISRWVTHGFDRQMAEKKAFGNDIPNGELVMLQSLPADIEFHHDRS